MNIEDKKRILSFYEDSFAKYGNDPRSIHWSGEISQNVRFEILNNIASLSGMSVLDVGCGLGDLYKFFISKQIPVDYTGIDIVPSFIERARERFPEAEFEVRDAINLKKDFDYIFASGTLNLTIENSKEYYFDVIEKMFAHSKHGLAFNMLDFSSHPTDETYVSFSVDEVVAYCKTISNNVVVTRGYLPQDFTVYMYRE